MQLVLLYYYYLPLTTTHSVASQVILYWHHVVILLSPCKPTADVQIDSTLRWKRLSNAQNQRIDYHNNVKIH